MSILAPAFDSLWVKLESTEVGITETFEVPTSQNTPDE
jgi:hypothetical protein